MDQNTFKGTDQNLCDKGRDLWDLWSTAFTHLHINNHNLIVIMMSALFLIE